MFQTLKKKGEIKFQTSLSRRSQECRVLTESLGLGSAGGGAGSPPWRMRSHYQKDENSTSRISQLLCLSHGSVKLGTINR